MERQFKTCGDGAWYCAPRDLLAVVCDLQCEAGQWHTIILPSASSPCAGPRNTRASP